jgi:hypothetical protein
VADAVTPALLDSTLRILHDDVCRLWGMPRPRIAVCGLNPHAGESGYLGREEIDAIAPAIANARARGIDAVGPIPADTVFVPAHARAYDAIVAMYHDQGLPVLACRLRPRGQRDARSPHWRTSVDHGTALDLAGTGLAAGQPRASHLPRTVDFHHQQHVLGAAERAGFRDQQFVQLGLAAQPDQALVEIGPGRGALTERLLGRARTLDAVEIDRDLVALLRERLGANPGFELHQCDALEFDFAALAQTARHRQPAIQHFHAAAVPCRGRA